MVCHIIHLPERSDRMQLLKHELIEQGIIDYRLWKGVRSEEKPWQGISKAHKQVVMYAKELGLPVVLIVEDDVKFTDKGAFDFFVKNMPDDFDMYLGGIIYGNVKDDNSVNNFSGLTLYIVKENFYDTFLSIPENIHLDRGLKSKGKFIVCNPMVAIQHNGYSDNSKREMNYTGFLSKRTLFRNDKG